MDDVLMTRLSSAMLYIRKAAAALTDRQEFKLMELLAMRALEQNRLDSQTNVFAQDLCERLNASKATVSQMLSALEKNGYVERDFNLNNRRKLILTLTDKGERALIASEAEYERLLCAVIKDFGEQNARTMVDLFEHFASSVQRQTGSAIIHQGR